MITGTGIYFDIVRIFTKTETEDEADVTEIWDEGVEARAEVKQIDGTRYLTNDELVDREVFEIKLWDNDWGSNISISFMGKTLYPIRPPMRNPDRTMRGKVIIVAATKV
jgi:hypothetical protein